MQMLYKLIFYASISLLVIFVCVAVALNWLPLEFTNATYADIFATVFVFGIPILMLLTLCRLGFKPALTAQKKKVVVIQTIITAAAALLLIFLYGLGTALDLCGWTTGKALFKKINGQQKIVEREFGCGAVDAAAPTIKIAREVYITPVFVYFTPIDTNTLNKAEWIKVETKN
ncbi:MAG TPA: hypothetical protein VHB48_02490 [Chitinophagaceae bacterium]|nr:hypothetical protein [Chitinophagaceae bacterium]